MKLSTQARYKREILGNHDAIPWLIRHSAEFFTRYQVDADGRTGWRKMRGKEYRREIFQFGESVMFLKPKTLGKEKMESRWETGIWLGVRDESGEHLMGTPKGVIKVRTIRLISDDAERWNLTLIHI